MIDPAEATVSGFEDTPQAKVRVGRSDDAHARPADEAAADKAQARAKGDVSHVLRSAFQATIDETVPDAMLDLLAKLS